MLTDKLGELSRAQSWMVLRDKDDNGEDEFSVVVNLGPPDNHMVQTKKYKNVHKAVDEAIDLFKAHLSKCPCC